MGSLKIGADPELFLMREGQFHSAVNFIPGTKREPFAVTCGAVQVDGMALEFNIDAAADEQQFVMHINEVLSELRQMIPPEFELALAPVAHFTPEHMAEQPDEAKALGCDPDFCAYSESKNPQPDQHPTMRTASGHVHIGWTDDANPMDIEHFYKCCDLAKQLDYLLGVPSLLFDPDEQRRKMYGKAGCFRPKKYGMEYRTLSNFWLATPELTTWVYRNTVKGYQQMEGGLFYPDTHGDRAMEIINSNNIEAAAELARELDLA